MTLSNREPEYIVEEKSERTSQEWDLSRTLNPILLAQVQVKSKHLSVEVNMLQTTLGEILDLLQELAQSEQVQE